MPKYHFIIAQDDVIHRDGFELPDMNAAWHEATKTCGEMIRDLDGSLKPDSRWALTIQDRRANLSGRLRSSPRMASKTAP